jgi:deoxyribodipyrimidine photolyase
VCAGNWNWISCGDPEEVVRTTVTFCPIKYGKKMDPNGEYIRYVCIINVFDSIRIN